MQSLNSIIGSHWWRFSDYQIVEIDNIWYIRPAPGARLEPYEWLPVESEDGLSSRQQLIGEHYQSLLNLDLRSHDAILDWCRTYGLLGILPQQAVQITLAARWMPIFQDHWPKVLSPHQVNYVRTNMGWRRTLEHSMGGEDSVIGEMEPAEVTRVIERFEDHINTLVEDPRDTVLPGPNALVQPFPALNSRDIELHQVQSLGAVIAPFFPDVPLADVEGFIYPLPLSDTFWHEYAEPLREFQWAAGDFKNMVENLSHMHESHFRSVDLARHGEAQINSLLTVNPVFSAGRSTAQQWNIPSLLALFALELEQGIRGGKNILNCKRPRCRRVFLSGQYNQAYCSDQCRLAEEKARQRARNRK